MDNTINPELVEEVYEFYNAVDETLGKGSWGYQPRAKKGSRDGHKTEKRVVWKRDYFGKLYQDHEENK